MELNQMKDEVDSILSAHKANRDRLQELLKLMALHVDQHGNVTPFAYLVDRLATNDAKGLNIRAIGDWINAFTKCEIKYDAVAKKHVASYKHSKVTQLNGKGYKNWYEFKASTISDEYSLMTILQTALTRANKELKNKTTLINDGNLEAAAKIQVTHAEVAALRKLIAAENSTLPQVVEDQDEPAAA